jgi:hypothetical protein
LGKASRIGVKEPKPVNGNRLVNPETPPQSQRGSESKTDPTVEVKDDAGASFRWRTDEPRNKTR